MGFRWDWRPPTTCWPTATGEVLSRGLVPPLPTPRHLNEWRRAATIAVVFWQRVAQDPRISQYLQSETSRMIEVNRSLMERLGQPLAEDR